MSDLETTMEKLKSSLKEKEVSFEIKKYMCEDDVLEFTEITWERLGDTYTADFYDDGSLRRASLEGGVGEVRYSGTHKWIIGGSGSACDWIEPTTRKYIDEWIGFSFAEEWES